MEKQIISFTANAFIIPNGAREVSEFISLDKANGTYRYLQEFAKLNNTEICDSDKVVQVWFHSNEVDSDNVVDHGFKVTLNDGTQTGIRPSNLQWIPAKMLEGIKEGDSMMLVSPAFTNYNRTRQSKIDVILHISMICQQKGYRYARFGNFEEVVKSVCK